MLHHTDFRVHQNIEKGGPECELTQDIKRHSISWRTGKLDWKQKPIWLLQTLFILKIEIEQWIWPDVLKWYNGTESLPMHSSVFLKQTKKNLSSFELQYVLGSDFSEVSGNFMQIFE